MRLPQKFKMTMGTGRFGCPRKLKWRWVPVSAADLDLNGNGYRSVRLPQEIKWHWVTVGAADPEN